MTKALLDEPTEAIPSKLGSYIDAAKMCPRELGLWLERFVQSKTDTTGYGWDDRWKAQRAREMLDHLDASLRSSAPQEPEPCPFTGPVLSEDGLDEVERAMTGLKAREPVVDDEGLSVSARIMRLGDMLLPPVAQLELGEIYAAVRSLERRLQAKEPETPYCGIVVMPGDEGEE